MTKVMPQPLGSLRALMARLTLRPEVYFLFHPLYLLRDYMHVTEG